MSFDASANRKFMPSAVPTHSAAPSGAARAGTWSRFALRYPGGLRAQHNAATARTGRNRKIPQNAIRAFVPESVHSAPKPPRLMMPGIGDERCLPFRITLFDAMTCKAMIRLTASKRKWTSRIDTPLVDRGANSRYVSSCVG